MITEESSIFISRPVEDVFAFVTDPSKAPRWQTDVVEARAISEGPIGVGSIFKVMLRLMGRRDCRMEVTGYEPNRLVVLQLTSGLPLGLRPKISHLLETIDGGTQYTRRVEIRPEGFARLMPMRPMVRRMNASFVANLRRILED